MERDGDREIENFMVKKLVTFSLFLVLSQLQTLTSFSAVNTDFPAINTESSEEGWTECIGEKRKKMFEQNPGINGSDQIRVRDKECSLERLQEKG